MTISVRLLLALLASLYVADAGRIGITIATMLFSYFFYSSYTIATSIAKDVLVSNIIFKLMMSSSLLALMRNLTSTAITCQKGIN